ncbi:MAG: ankyrin repeat domain-containing protein [Acidobacteriota bacterium]
MATVLIAGGTTGDEIKNPGSQENLRTAFHEYAEEGPAEDLETTERVGKLVAAAEQGDLPAVRSWLDQGVPIESDLAGSRSALFAAIQGGHSEMVAFLLSRGADPSRRGPRQRSALEESWRADALDIARNLLEAGAEVSAPPRSSVGAGPNRRRSLVSEVIAKGRRDWFDLLWEHGARLKDGEASPLLLRKLETESPDRLHWMRLLLDFGGEPNQLSQASGRTLIHLAETVPEIELLAFHGADLEAADRSFGETALYSAAKSGNEPQLEALLRLGADLDARAKDGSTPLLAAISLRHFDLAHRLLDAGARVDLATSQGRTPLMELAAWRLPRTQRATGDEAQNAMIRRLLAQGAAHDAADARGNSALSLAGKACNVTAFAELARGGARMGRDAWIEVLSAPCAPRWPEVIDSVRADLNLPLPSLDELTKGPLAPPDPADLRAQRQTLDEMRAIGAAWMSWFVDQVSSLELPGGTVRFASDEGAGNGVFVGDLPPVSASQLHTLLVPLYLGQLPAVDGWGYDYDFRMASHPLGRSPVLVIRSPGSDGRFEGELYPAPHLEKGSFAPFQVHRDIVWTDGRFLQFPRTLPAAFTGSNSRPRL